MTESLQLPDPPPEERTPLVEQLLGLVEHLLEENQRQAETIQQLRDEIAILKGEKAKPKFKPSGMEGQTNPSDGSDDNSQGSGEEGSGSGDEKSGSGDGQTVEEGRPDDPRRDPGCAVSSAAARRAIQRVSRGRDSGLEDRTAQHPLSPRSVADPGGRVAVRGASERAAR